MPPKRTSTPLQPAQQRVVPYDLRKVHIPRIPAPGSGEPNTYIPRSATTQASAIRRRAAAAKAAKANAEAEAESSAPAEARAAAARGKAARSTATPNPEPRRGVTPQRRVHFQGDSGSNNSSKATPKATPRAPPKPALATPPPVPSSDAQSEDIEEEDDIEDEEEEDEEEEEDDNDNETLPSIGDSDLPVEIEEVMERLYTSKERAKELLKDHYLEKVKRRYPEGFHQLPRDVETSDLEPVLETAMLQSNFLIGLYLNVRVNKKPLVKKTLGDTTRRDFNISAIEIAMENVLLPILNDEEYEIMTRRASVKHSSGRGRVSCHDFDDFDPVNTDRILELIDKHHLPRSSGQVEVLFDISVNCEGIKPANIARKRRHSEHLPDNPSSDMPSSPPPIPKRRVNRSDRLLEQHNVRLESIRVAGDFQRQLMDRWRCNDGNCTNKDNFCFPDPLDRSKHYNITAPQHEMWSNAITAGEATIQNPPAKLLKYWEQQQGSINRLSRQPARQAFAQQTKSALDRMMEMQQQLQEQAMHQRLMDQIAAMEERQERREERNEQRRIQQDIQGLKAQSYCPTPASYKTTFYQPQPLNPYSPPNLYSPPNPVYPTPQIPRTSPQIPLASKRAEPQRLSSPINREIDDYEMLDAFFNWKIINTSHPPLQEKWYQARDAVFQNDWSIKDLQDMEDSSGEMYKRAIKAGMTDGFARGLRGQLQKYKIYYRQLKEVEHQAE